MAFFGCCMNPKLTRFCKTPFVLLVVGWICMYVSFLLISFGDPYQEVSRHPIPITSMGNGLLKSNNDSHMMFGRPFFIYIIGCKRELRSLLDNLTAVGCPGESNLYIFLDKCDSLPPNWSDVLKYNWKCGYFNIKKMTKKQGLRNMWLSVFRHIAAQGVASYNLILEDDVRVSKFAWQGLTSLLPYTNMASHRVGVSLSVITKNEMTGPPFQDWSGVDSVTSCAFETTLPSSWAPVYESWVADPFLTFVYERLQHNYNRVEEESSKSRDYGRFQLQPKVLELPDHRSNVWPHSWKKFMIEWMYINGYTMIYPNLKNGVAASLFLPGEHTYGKIKQHGLNQGVYKCDIPRLPVVNNFLKASSLYEIARESVAHVYRMGKPFKSVALAGGGRQCFLDRVKNLPRTLNYYDNVRTFSYMPQYGINNQIIAYKHAILMQDIIGRVVIPPELHYPRASANPQDSRPVSRFFETTTVSVAPRRDPPGFTLIVEPTPIAEKLVPGSHEIVFGNLSQAAISLWLSSCKDSSLHFNGMFSSLNSLHSSLVAFNSKMKLLADKTGDYLGGMDKYTCVHLRNGDFYSACDQFKKSNKPWFNNLFKQGYLCKTYVEDILKFINLNQRLLVISPEPLPSILDVTTSLDVDYVVKKMGGTGPLESLFVEQMLCSRSRNVILNRFSTFSSLIKEMRDGNKLQGVTYFKRATKGTI